MAMTMPMPAKITRLVISGRTPARMPPPSQNISPETITAVATRSAQTGRPDDWITSRSQVSGHRIHEITVLISTRSLPINHSSGPIAEDALKETSLSPPSPMLPLKPDRMFAVQLTPNPFNPPPCSRKKATTGNATKNRVALMPLPGSRGINIGTSSITASRYVRLTRQRSASG